MRSYTAAWLVSIVVADDGVARQLTTYIEPPLPLESLDCKVVYNSCPIGEEYTPCCAHSYKYYAANELRPVPNPADATCRIKHEKCSWELQLLKAPPVPFHRAFMLNQCGIIHHSFIAGAILCFQSLVQRQHPRGEFLIVFCGSAARLGRQ